MLGTILAELHLLDEHQQPVASQRKGAIANAWFHTVLSPSELIRAEELASTLRTMVDERQRTLELRLGVLVPWMWVQGRGRVGQGCRRFRWGVKGTLRHWVA